MTRDYRYTKTILLTIDEYILTKRKVNSALLLNDFWKINRIVF